MNISYIIRIEGRPSPVGGIEQPFVAIPFLGGTAAYEQKETRSNQGILYKCTLSFKMAGITSDNQEAVARFRRARFVRVTDVNGLKIILGDEHIRLIVTTDQDIEGTPGSFRGYKVKAEWNTPHPPMVESFI